MNALFAHIFTYNDTHILWQTYMHTLCDLLSTQCSSLRFSRIFQDGRPDSLALALIFAPAKCSTYKHKWCETNTWGLFNSLWWNKQSSQTLLQIIVDSLISRHTCVTFSQYSRAQDMCPSCFSTFPHQAKSNFALSGPFRCSRALRFRSFWSFSVLSFCTVGFRAKCFAEQHHLTNAALPCHYTIMFLSSCAGLANGRDFG